jgi:hypothetical protein
VLCYFILNLSLRLWRHKIYINEKITKPGPPPTFSLPVLSSPPDDMHPIPTRILLLFLSFSSLVAAVDLAQCLDDFKAAANSTADGGVDSQGRPTSPVDAVGFTYKTCVEQCGSGAIESFGWNGFTRSFSSWFLPWLALISELPFGSLNYADDFASG